MATRGNSIIKGIPVTEVIELLNRAYADEWLAYYQYFIESKVIKGIMKDAAIAELDQHAADELRHATMVADRILQLGGTPLLSPQDWFKETHCGYEAPENADVVSILEDAIKGEQCAISVYSNIAEITRGKGEQCAISVYSNIAEITRGKDIVTYDLVSRILADEVEHEEDLQALHDDITEFVEQIKGTISGES
ncbi:MAG: ferritin [Campylobacteraceae bacterium 4484_4]|nr:MAG: ferritin [Campylobacteraceae bacterium 4484_4]